MKIKVLNDDEVDVNIGEMSLNRYKIGEEGYVSTTTEETTFREVVKGSVKDANITASGINDRNLDYIGVNDVKLFGEQGAEEAEMKGTLDSSNVALKEKRNENAIEFDPSQIGNIITKDRISSNVGEQDKEPNPNDIAGNLASEGKKMLNSAFGIGTAINELKEVFGPSEPAITEFDKNMVKLQQWKDDHVKTIHTSDWYETPFLNQPHNAANNMKDDFRGELGKTTSVMSNGFGTGNAWAKLAGDSLNLLGGAGLANTAAQIAGSFGADGGDAGDASWQSDIDEIAVLGTVTKDTMYISKPGMRFKAHYSDGMVENITGRNGWGVSDYHGTHNATKAGREMHKQKLDLQDKNLPTWYNGSTFTTFKQRQEEYSFEEESGRYSWKVSNKDFSASNPSEEDMRLVTFLRNRNTFNKHLGYLYIRPFYNGYNEGQEGNEDNKDGSKTNIYNNLEKGFRFFDIPFEFNPEISESATQANYASEGLLGRLGQFHVYTGTNLPTLNISLTYLALAPDVLAKEDRDRLGAQFSTDSWQYFWTNNKIEEIELKLRSLVFADYVSAPYIVKPPIVELHLENASGQDFDTVGDLFKYPNGINNPEEAATLSNNVGGQYLAYSTALHSGTDSNRYKKYIVTSVQIDKVSQDADFIFPSLYGRRQSNLTSTFGNPINNLTLGEENKGFAGYTRKRGFKATLTLQEVTENFLDLVPDFKAYYDAWIYKEMQSNMVNQVAAWESGDVRSEMFQSVESILTGDIQSLGARLATGEEKIEKYYAEVQKSFRLYAAACTPKLKNIEGKEKDVVDSYIYLYNNGEAETTGEGYNFFWGGATKIPATSEKNTTDVKIRIPVGSSKALSSIKQEEMPQCYKGARPLSVSYNGGIMNLDGSKEIIDIYKNITDKENQNQIKIFEPSAGTSENKAKFSYENIVENMDILFTAAEKLKEEYDNIDEYFDVDGMYKNIKVSGIKLYDIYKKSSDTISDIFDCIEYTYKVNAENYKKWIDRATAYFTGASKTPDVNFEIKAESWQKPTKEADKKKYEKFIKIKKFVDLVKFLGEDSDKVYLIGNFEDRTWRVPLSQEIVRQFNWVDNKLFGGYIKNIKVELGKAWIIKEKAAKKEILKDNISSIIYGGNFNVLTELKTETQQNITVKVPCFFTENNLFEELELDLSKCTYEGKKLDFRTFIPYAKFNTDNAIINVIGINNYIKGIEDGYNEAYRGFTRMVKQANEITGSKAETSNLSFGNGYSDGVDSFKGEEDVLDIASSQCVALLTEGNAKFEETWRLIDAKYNKDNIAKEINAYFIFSSGDESEEASKEVNDIAGSQAKANKSEHLKLIDVVPGNTSVFDLKKENDAGQPKYYCYKTDGDYSLKLDQFPEDRTYDEQNGHGKIYELQIAKHNLENVQINLSKATNPSAVKNYNKLSS